MAKLKIQIAREFRKNPTKSEKIMWQALRSRRFRGLKFRRQHLTEGYILDFYCHEIGLVIEIDGLIHQQQIKDDKERQKIIEHFNIKFFRVKSSEVEADIDGVLKRLERFITPHPTLSRCVPRGRGKNQMMGGR